MTSYIVITITIIIGVISVDWILRSIRLFTGNSPPSPFAWPILGHDPLILSYMKDFSQHEFFVWLAEKYGPIVRLNRMSRDIYVVSDAAAAKSILAGNDFMRGDRLQQFTKGITDYALFVLPTGSLWHTHRKLLQPSFGPHHLKASVQVAKNKCMIVEGQWRELLLKNDRNSCIVESYKQFQALTLDIIGEIAFSHDFGALKAHFSGSEISEGQKEWDQLFQCLQRRFMYPPFLWKWAGLASTSPKVIKTKTSLMSFLEQLIDRKRKEVASNQFEKREDKTKDVLDRLIQTAGENKNPLSDDEIQGEVLGFFLAGHETTANALTWIFYVLSQHLDVEQKLYEEIRHAPEELSTEYLQSLTYLDCVVKEVLRLHPVVHVVPRESVKDTVICGYHIPKNSPTLVAVRAIHHSAKYWPDPLSFQPDRWTSTPQPGTYLPFGDGPHSCIGMKLAMLEIKVCLVYLLARFSIKLVPGQELRAVTMITTGLRNGCRIEIRARK